MGSENSKDSSRNNDHVIFERALEQQRRTYEERFSELIENQIQINEEARSQNSINRNNIQSGITTASTLYPNLQTVSNNNLQTAAVNSPTINHSSASSTRSQSSVTTEPIFPSAPLINMNNEEVSRTGARPMNRWTTTNSINIPARSAKFNNVNNGAVLNKGARPKSRLRQPRKATNNVGVACVTCKNDFGAQIFQCTDGHSSCNQCRYLNKTCGICSKLITDIRNITLEGTIADINIKINPNERIKCHNAKDGCSLSFTINEMDSHLLQCPFKDMECPLASIYQNCSWHGKINHIVKHFEEMHPQNCVADVDKEMNLTLKENQRIIYLVAIGSYIFLVNIKVQLSEKMIYMVTQLIGTQVSASKWTYELHLYNKREPRRKYQYTDVCHSNVTSLGEIFDKVKCAAFTTDYAQTFVNEGVLKYKFFLTKTCGRKRN